MTVLVVGDSFSPNSPTGWPTLLGQRLCLPVVNRSNAGAGYLSAGFGWPARFSRQLLAPTTPADVRLVILFGGVNDRWWAGRDLLPSTVFQTLLLLRSAYPQARQLIVGPQWSGPDPLPGEVPKVREAILDGMWGLDWQHPYVDPIPDDRAQWWFPPTRPDLWAADRFHPNDAGQRVIVDRIEPHARQALGL